MYGNDFRGLFQSLRANFKGERTRWTLSLSQSTVLDDDFSKWRLDAFSASLAHPDLRRASHDSNCVIRDSLTKRETLAKVGIMPGCYGMTNGQKPENWKKKKWKTKWKTAPAGQGQEWRKKWKKWRLPRKSFILLFFARVQLGAVFHLVFHFIPISGFWTFSMPYQSQG